MKTKLTLLAAGILLTAPITGVSQSTIQFSTNIYYVLENTLNLNLPVRRTGDVNVASSVDFASANGTATAGLDYGATNGTLIFQVGETNQIIVVPILTDGLVETANETFTVTLSNPTNAVLGARTIANARITDNDKGIQLELATYPVAEEIGVVTIRVVRRDDSEFPISVDYTTAPSSAVNGQDYLDTAGTLTFAAGEAVKPITVAILNDNTRESNKSFSVLLTNVSGTGVFGSPKTATVIITNTDDLVRFAATGMTNREEAAFVRVPVIRGESALAATVDAGAVGYTAIADQDFVAVTNTLSFAPGDRLKFIDVPLLKDGLKESSEIFRVVLSNPTGGAVLTAPTTVWVTILDNDPGVGFEQATNSVWEKLPGLTINVVRGNDGWLGQFTVDYQTTNGTAVAGVDYQAASGTLNFATNEMIQSIHLELLSDSAPEVTKYFTVLLTNLAGPLTLGRNSTRVNIVDNSSGNTNLLRPTMRGGIAQTGGVVHVTWPGVTAVQRADSLAGPWEVLGVMDSPYLTAPNLPGAFYRLESARPARLYVPSSYDGQTPMPLVVVLHGYSGDAAQMAGYFRIEPLAEARGFLVCHPDGTIDRNNYRFWNATEACCNFYGSEVDDSGYLRALIEEIARQYAVDRKRIYAMGVSNGGFMSHRLACDHADLIAGIVSLAGAAFLDPNTSPPAQRVNVLQIHGTADDVVPYAGGPLIGLPVVGYFPGAVATVQNWAAFNSCHEPQWDAQPTMDFDPALPGLDTTVTRYTNSPPGGAVELWTINGSLHWIPTLTAEFAPRTIDWLLAHPKP